MTVEHHPQHASSRGRWVFWGFAAVAVFFLFTEHRAHVLGLLSYALLLACPLMHLFHHGGHGGHHRGDNGEKRGEGTND